MTQIDMATGNRAHGLDERGHDLYQTPEVAVTSLLALEELPATIWEPACGPGAIVAALRAAGRRVIASDLVDYGLADSAGGRDFLLEREAPQGCEAIVTNPPFKLAEEFVEHALRLCPEVYMLLRVGFLEGLRWEGGLAEHFARLHVFAPRLPMMHREGWTGPKASSAMACGWYVFRRGYARITRAPATVHWVNWRKLAKAAPRAPEGRETAPAPLPLLALMGGEG